MISFFRNNFPSMTILLLYEAFILHPLMEKALLQKKRPWLKKGLWKII